MTHPSDPSSPASSSASERAAVDALIDTLLPASADGRLPAASQLGIGAVLAARAAERSDLAAQLELCLTKLDALAATRGATFATLANDARIELVQALAAAEPVAFAALQRETYVGYYMHPRVPALFAFPDRPPQPLGHQQPADDLEALLAPVRARGRRYRDDR